jgi:regulatory protein YycI of two-component signal transduction system YycFG
MKIKNIIVSIVLIILLFITVNFVNLKRLPTYNMSNDGRTIEKDNIQYISLGIANDENIGRRIGKIEYNSETSR